jgi:hypothetical protein
LTIWIPLGVTSSLKASLKNRESPMAHRSSLWSPSSVVAGGAPRCALSLIALVCPATLGIVVVVYRSRADALPLLLLASSLADALLPRVSWPLPCTDALPSGRLGGCFAAFGSLVPLSGRCFVAESVWAHFLADAWPPWSLGLLWQMLCHHCCRMLLCLLWVDALPPRLCLCCGQP